MSKTRDDDQNEVPQATIGLPASLDAPALARLHLRQFRSHLTPPVLDDALILTSELVTNAVLHGKPEISLSIRVDAPNLTVTVSDEGAVIPAETPDFPPPDTPRGRGLAIVDSLATRWGISPQISGPGKAVWFVLQLP